jgi:hypothetical protein
MNDDKTLSGYYDSPKNINTETGQPFGDKCPLSELYWTLDGSNNAILKEKAKCLNYNKKFYSYVLVVEDKQQPELVGKILVFQYGKTIKDKIMIEKNGEISGEPCNVFKLHNGKDFQLIVKEVQDDKGNTFPDYKMCQFKPTISSISLPSGGVMKNVPLDENGMIPSNLQAKIKEFFLAREVNIEDFSPKALTEEQVSKIGQITAKLTGQTVANNTVADADDFSFDSMDEVDNSTEQPSTSSQSDDEFFDF